MANIKQVRVWDKAHIVLEKLAEMLAKEKGLTMVSLTDAASIAILEAHDRRNAPPHVLDDTRLRSIREYVDALPEPTER